MQHVLVYAEDMGKKLKGTQPFCDSLDTRNTTFHVRAQRHIPALKILGSGLGKRLNNKKHMPPKLDNLSSRTHRKRCSSRHLQHQNFYGEMEGGDRRIS